MRYFDYTATTPIDEEVLNTYIRVQKNYFANTTSLHSLGQKSNALLNQVSSEIKEILGVNNHEIVYTTNATEANNLAIYGIVKNYSKGRIITTKIEHPSVYEVYRALENEGYDVVYLDVDKNGLISIDELKQKITPDTLLVSIMWVNNIVGSIQPIKDVIKVVHENKRTKLHVDIVQGLCKIVPDFKFDDIDLITFSGHKIQAPKGIGALLYKNNIVLAKRLYGSSSQLGVKPGTLDVALPASMCKALKLFYKETKTHYLYVKELNDYLRNKIKNFDFVTINSNIDCSPYIFNISIPSVNGETIVHVLEAREIYVSTGSACSSKLKKPEKTIYNMTHDELLATTTIRISLSYLTKKEEIDDLIASIGEIKNV